MMSPQKTVPGDPMPVILYISRLSPEVQGHLPEFSLFFCRPEPSPVGACTWLPAKSTILRVRPTETLPVGRVQEMVRIPKVELELHEPLAGLPYIARRHQAVCSMLRNFVLSPRER